MNPSRRKKLFRIGLLEDSEKIEKAEEKPVEQLEVLTEVVKETSDAVVEPEVVVAPVIKKSKKTV